jgi:hypothetical protein
MREDGFALVATSARANDLMHAATSSDDADRSKPDPDVVRSTLVRSVAGAPERIGRRALAAQRHGPLQNARGTSSPTETD